MTRGKVQQGVQEVPVPVTASSASKSVDRSSLMGRIQASAVSVQNSAVSAAAHLCTLAGNLSGNLSGLRLNSNGIEEEGVHQELEEELEI